MDRDVFNNNSGKNQTTPDLASLIKSRQQKKFIKTIFNGNKEDYEKFLKRVSNIKTYKDAGILLDFYLYRNEVDPSSKEAIDFRNVMYFAYFPKKGKQK